MMPRIKRSKPEVQVLLSGGIDSCALAGFYLLQAFSVKALFVDFGQPSAKQELRAAKAICRRFKVPLLVYRAELGGSFLHGEIPGRNAFLLFTALMARHGRPSIVAIGIHDGAPYYDCGKKFLTEIQTIFDGYSAGRTTVSAPFLKWNKLMIWQFSRKHGFPVDQTYSCEKGGRRPCGACLSCLDRRALRVS